MFQMRTNCSGPGKGQWGPRATSTNTKWNCPVLEMSPPGTMLPVVKNLGPRGKYLFTLEGTPLQNAARALAHFTPGLRSDLKQMILNFTYCDDI